MRSLRSILGIRWQDRVTNLEVLDQAESTSIESRLIKSQFRWVGHVIRMEDQRMPRHLLYGELSQGNRKRGRPKKRYKDAVKANLKACGIQPKSLEETAEDRSTWRSTVHDAIAYFEDSRSEKLTTARTKRHNRTIPQQSQFQCPHCYRFCASKLGLLSHSRIHR